MLLRIDPKADAIAPLDHCAVTPDIDPTLLGVAHDDTPQEVKDHINGIYDRVGLGGRKL